MAVETDADRAVFLDTDEFGVVMTWNGTPIDGIFDNDHYLADPGVGAMVATSQPQLQCRTNDIRGMIRGDTVTIASVETDPQAVVAPASKDYSVVDIEPDGTGMSVIVLARRT